MPYEWLRIAFATIATYGIEPYEVVQVLGSAKRLPRPMASPQGVRALMIYGRTAPGRPLVVMVRLTGQRVAMIIGARDMTVAERKEFEVWESR